MSPIASLKSPKTVLPVDVILVSRDHMTKIYDRACFVSRTLHRIENLSELDWEQMNDLCRSMHQVKTLLQQALEAKP